MSPTIEKFRESRRSRYLPSFDGCRHHLNLCPGKHLQPTVPESMTREIVATTRGIVTRPFRGADNRQLYDYDVSRTWLPLKLTVDYFERAVKL